jgi:hypothetical protein
MAPRTKPSDDATTAGTVSRTYRMAVKIGEDYLTIEETVSLPVAASDEDVQAAVALGWRIYTQQRAAAEAQILEARESYGGDNERPVLDSQLQRIHQLQQLLGWNAQELEQFLSDRGLDSVRLTRQQATHVVQLLRRIHDDAQRQNSPANRRQIADIQRATTAQHLDVDALVQRLFGESIALEALTFGEANQLLQAIEKHRRARA